MDAGFYKTYFEIEKNHWWFRVRRNIILSLIKKYKISKTAKIFDFGCGSGYTVGYLQKLGYDVSGSDTSQEAIKFGRKEGIKNLQIVESGTMPPNSSFDLILALDVIEHIKDDAGAIKALERALKPGGMFIITAPAYQWMWGVQDKVAHHFRRYNMGTLLRLFEDTNLSVLKRSYFNTFLFLSIAAVRLAGKLFKTKDRESDFDINNRLANAVFYFIFNLESKLLRFFNFPFGVSILLVLRKNGHVQKI